MHFHAPAIQRQNTRPILGFSSIMCSVPIQAFIYLLNESHRPSKLCPILGFSICNFLRLEFSWPCSVLLTPFQSLRSHPKCYYLRNLPLSLYLSIPSQLFSIKAPVDGFKTFSQSSVVSFMFLMSVSPT